VRLQEEKHRSVVADFLLLVTALVWGFGFVAQRAGMEYVGPFTFNGIRFLLGGICLLPLAGRVGQTMSAEIAVTVPSIKAGFWAGCLLFCGAGLQQVGLLSTSAGKAGFITGLYVIFVPIFGLVFGQRTSIGTWLGALLATIGMYLFSQCASGFYHRHRRSVCSGRRRVLGSACASTRLPFSAHPSGASCHGAVSLLRLFQPACCPVFRGRFAAVYSGRSHSHPLRWILFGRDRLYLADGCPALGPSRSCIHPSQP